MKIFNDKKFIRMEVIRLAQRGRKPKPTAVKQLEGNPGKRQLNANEPKPVWKKLLISMGIPCFKVMREMLIWSIVSNE